VDDVFIGFRITAPIVHIPTKRAKQGIYELAPKLRFIVRRREEFRAARESAQLALRLR
jgi:hypothetical protein